MKKKLKRGWMLALCAAAIIPLAAIPLGWFALTDAALVGQTHPQKAPYTSVVPTGDDYYLLRQLNTRVELAARGATRSLYEEGDEMAGMYLSGSTYIDGMTPADASMQQYLQDVLDSLSYGGVLPSEWLAIIRREIDYWGAQVYYSTDTLGFVRLVAFGGEAQEICILNLEVESLTGKVVSLWADTEETASIDVGNVLLAWVELNELDGLGDWTVPVGTEYEQSGLYSENGQALMTCATGTDNSIWTQAGQSERYYFSLQLGPRDLEVSQ